MATEPFLGEIRAVAFNFAPRGWALCNGQLLAIQTNAALFSILGTTYGGDGRTTFALPNLQGATPVHPNGNTVQLGAAGGSTTVTLTAAQCGHSHPVAAVSAAANQSVPTGHLPAATGQVYGVTQTTSLNQACLTPAGGGQPHNNLQPYTVVNYVIALQGIFPSRN